MCLGGVVSYLADKDFHLTGLVTRAPECASLNVEATFAVQLESLLDRAVRALVSHDRACVPVSPRQ